MAAEDRDRIFEKVLAKHLRAANANGGVDAGALQTPNACPDAETLAAYHERSLSDEQAATAKQHILACEHCQAVLEQLAASDEIPLGLAASTAETQTAGVGVHVLKPRRTQIWRWVAPAGAIAAAVLVWVNVRENTRVHKLPTNEMTQTAAPTPAVPQFQSVPEAIAKAKTPNAAPLAAQIAPTVPRSDGDHSRLRDKTATYSDEASTFLPKSQPGPAPTPSAGARQETLQQDLKSEEAELSRDIAAAEEKQKLDAATDTLNQVIPAAPTREQGAAAVGGALSRTTTAEHGESSKSLKKRAATAPQPAAPAQEQQMDGMSRFKEAPSVLLANSTASITVAVPGGSASWRIGPSGYIAHSADAGKTWTPQVSGVTTGLVAGNAVSQQICWLVGHAGTVLLTIDGGGHWQKLTAPTRDDLLSVSAIDARQATVSTAVGAYQTSDAGATWHRFSPQ